MWSTTFSPWMQSSLWTCRTWCSLRANQPKATEEPLALPPRAAPTTPTASGCSSQASIKSLAVLCHIVRSRLCVYPLEDNCTGQGICNDSACPLLTLSPHTTGVDWCIPQVLLQFAYLPSVCMAVNLSINCLRAAFSQCLLAMLASLNDALALMPNCRASLMSLAVLP